MLKKTNIFSQKKRKFLVDIYKKYAILYIE